MPPRFWRPFAGLARPWACRIQPQRLLELLQGAIGIAFPQHDVAQYYMLLRIVGTQLVGLGHMLAGSIPTAQP